MRGSRDPSRPDVAALTAAGDREALRQALGHADAAIRARAADALATLADGLAIAPLRRLLATDRDDHVREEAAVALARLHARDATDDLIAALRRDRCEHVRETAATALGTLGEPRAVPALEHATSDRFARVRDAAAEALERLRG